MCLEYTSVMSLVIKDMTLQCYLVLSQQNIDLSSHSGLNYCNQDRSATGVKFVEILTGNKMFSINLISFCSCVGIRDDRVWKDYGEYKNYKKVIAEKAVYVYW